MDKKKLIYFAMCSLLALSSCTQEGPESPAPHSDTNRIFFRSYLPAVELSRAAVIESSNFTTCQVTCFNPTDIEYIDTEADTIRPFFRNIRFDRADDGRFLSSDEDDCRWPDAEHTLHFFAYYPAVDTMRKAFPQGFFNLVNESKRTEETYNISYKLNNFRVAKDIADQADFVTAYTSGTLTKDAEQGLKLDFKHQLARIELSAWSGSEKYDFEIAGVRIGNPMVEADFDFTALMPGSDKTSPWIYKDGPAPVEHIFGQGEKVVSLSYTSGKYTSSEDATSIMGTAGPAMVLPMTERIEAWEGKNDPFISQESYSTDKMYFSVLLRVKNVENGGVAYPYPNDRDGMKVVYLAVDNDGKVTRRLYKKGSNYYTSEAMSEETLFTPADTDNIYGFGWAALPVPAKWEAGKIYAYKLNYSDGIGWHDPSDPKPGEPIIERGRIPFEMNVEEWADAKDYEPNIDVPKR